MIKTVLLFFSVVNGHPVGPTGHIIPTTSDCRAELAAVNGINHARQNSGIVVHASCEPVGDRR